MFHLIATLINIDLFILQLFCIKTMETKTGYSNMKRSSSVPLSKNEYSYSYSDDDSNSDSWTTTSGSSPETTIGSGLPITPIKKINSSFDRLSNSTDSFNEKSTPKNGFLILSILMIFLSSFVLFNYPIQTTIIKSYIINSTTLNSTTLNSTNTILPTIDWWSEYGRQCCLMTNNTGMYSRVAGDCSANGRCMSYLIYWLVQYNQIFFNSTWINDCCYVFRPINTEYSNIYCSYTCLNTERSKVY